MRRFEAQAFHPALPDGHIDGSLTVADDALTFHDIEGVERYRLPVDALHCRLGGVDQGLVHFAISDRPRLEIVASNAEAVVATPPLANLPTVVAAVAEGQRTHRRFWAFVGVLGCVGVVALAGLVTGAVWIFGWLAAWLVP